MSCLWYNLPQRWQLLTNTKHILLVSTVQFSRRVTFPQIAWEANSFFNINLNTFLVILIRNWWRREGIVIECQEIREQKCLEYTKYRQILLTQFARKNMTCRENCTVLLVSRYHRKGSMQKISYEWVKHFDTGSGIRLVSAPIFFLNKSIFIWIRQEPSLALEYETLTFRLLTVLDEIWPPQAQLGC